MLDDVLSTEDAMHVGLDKTDARARKILNTFAQARAEVALEDPRVLKMLAHEAPKHSAARLG